MLLVCNIIQKPNGDKMKATGLIPSNLKFSCLNDTIKKFSSQTYQDTASGGSEYRSEPEDESEEDNGLENPPPTDEEKIEKGSVGREQDLSLPPYYPNTSTQHEARVTLQSAHVPNEAHIEDTLWLEHEPSEPSDPQHEASIELHEIAESEHEPHPASPSPPTPQDQELHLETAVQISVEEVERGYQSRLVAPNPPLPVHLPSGSQLVPNPCSQPESPAVCHPVEVSDGYVPVFIDGSRISSCQQHELVCDQKSMLYTSCQSVNDQCQLSCVPSTLPPATSPPAAVLPQEGPKPGSSTASVPYEAPSTKVSPGPGQPDDDDDNSSVSFDGDENSSFDSTVFDGAQSQTTEALQDEPNDGANAESATPATSSFEQEPRSPSLPRSSHGRKKKRRKGEKKS